MISTIRTNSPLAHEILSLSEYERKMKKYENCGDAFILPDMYVVVRVDAHRLVAERWRDFPDHQYPLSDVFYQALMETARFVMCSEIRFTCAFIHGDEISFLLDTTDRGSERRKARVISLISSIASAGFLMAMNRPAAFHAKLSELPTHAHAIDYFLWQHLVAERNFYSRILGIELGKRGINKEENARIIGGGIETMREHLHNCGLDEADYHPGVRRGSILFWDTRDNTPILSELTNLIISNEEYVSCLKSILGQAGVRVTEGSDAIKKRTLNHVQEVKHATGQGEVKRSTFRNNNRMPVKRFKI